MPPPWQYVCCGYQFDRAPCKLSRTVRSTHARVFLLACEIFLAWPGRRAVPVLRVLNLF